MYIYHSPLFSFLLMSPLYIGFASFPNSYPSGVCVCLSVRLCVHIFHYYPLLFPSPLSRTSSPSLLTFMSYVVLMYAYIFQSQF